MNDGMPRSGWMALLLLLSTACGGGDPGQQTWPPPSPAVSGPEASGSSGGAATGTSNTGSSTGGGSGAPATPGLDNGSGSAPATASGIAGSIDGGTSTGGTGSSSGGSPPAATPTPDAFAGAPAFSSQVGSSAHNPGQSCMKSGCHGPGGGETSFVIGGTVYKDYKGTTPAPGVEIRVIDTAGHAVSVYSGTNGNFYIHTGASGVTLPAIVGARDATTTRPMVTQLTTSGFNVGVGTMGSCASNGCHIVGGTDGGPVVGAYYPIHVP
jgi:hypothetical protein